MDEKTLTFYSYAYYLDFAATRWHFTIYFNEKDKVWPINYIKELAQGHNTA